MTSFFSARRQAGAGVLVRASRAAACIRALSVLTVLSALAIPSAFGHAILATPKAEAGSFYKASVGITHGCSGAPTREVVIYIPAGVSNVKPMPKPGWTIEIERKPLAQPRESHGRTVTDEVSRVRFYGGSLPNAYYDEFTLVATLPQQPGPLYWRVTQACDKGGYDWSEIPAEGQDAHALESPALRLDIAPGMHMGHQH